MRLFVGNLDWEITDRELRDTFVEHVGVESAQVVIDRATNKSKGFGFVEVPTEEEAALAIEKLNGAAIRDRRIRVERANGPGPRERREGTRESRR